MSDKKFPTEIKLWKYEIERKARKMGLVFPPIIYEIVDNDEMFELAAYGGYPVRFHHWSFGQEYQDMQRSGRFGMVIYEMVINTEPCYAYLLAINPVVTNKAVMAHVCGHADFFTNNYLFRDTPKGMHNTIADHAAIVENIRTEFGRERVDKFLEACMSIETMVDLFAPFIDRFPMPEKHETEEKTARKQPQRIRPYESLPYYMDKILNPPEFIEEQRKMIEEEEKKQIEVEKGLKTPPFPVRDILGFLLLHAPLEQWQMEIIRITRETFFFFYSGAQTKIMNEGEASLFEDEIMVKEGVLLDAELCPFARQEAGVLRAPFTGINPYHLGMALWKSIRFRWNTGRHGDVWENCRYVSVKERWDEFIICKRLCDKYGIDTQEFWRKWDEFSFLIQETYKGKGSYPAEYFMPSRYVEEWLLYEEVKEELLKLEEQHSRVVEFEREIEEILSEPKENGNSHVGLDRKLVRFKVRHDLWLKKGKPCELLWTSEELRHEINRRMELSKIRKRFYDGNTAFERISIPGEWFVWIKKNSDTSELGKGQEKMFEVRRTHNDISFIDEFFTQDFCEQEGFFTFGIEHDQWIPEVNREMDVWVIRNRNYIRIKEVIKSMFLNVGIPMVDLIDANYNNNRELLLQHKHDGRDLERKDLEEVLRRLWLVWGGQKGVHLETIETEWPKKLHWWERWRPPWYPPIPPPEIKRKKVRYSCTDGKSVNQYGLEWTGPIFWI